MMRGIVSDFDARDGVGIIESDDGDVVLFNMSNLEGQAAQSIAAGVRVKFVMHESRVGAHADTVSLVE